MKIKKCKNCKKEKYKLRNNLYYEKMKTDENYKIKRAIQSKIDKLKYPEKEKARQILTRDKLKHPELYPKICIKCNSTENIEFHHPDYNFPLSVYPLCKKHHIEIHLNINEVSLSFG